MKKHLFTLLFSIPLILSSCGDSESLEEDQQIKLGKTEYSMNYEDEKQIEATSVSAITYTSENEYNATVSQSGKITGGKVGKTTIVLENGYDKKKIDVIIDPKFTLYPEPNEKVKFGASKQDVKKIYGTPSFENTDGILYNEYYSIYSYIFLFDKNDKVTSIGVSCSIDKMSENLPEFLDERYQLIDYDEDELTLTFLNEKEDMGILFTPTEDFKTIMVIYLPNTGTKSDIDQFIKSEMNNFINKVK